MTEICEEFSQHLAGCNPCQVVVDNIRQTISLYRDGQPYEMPKNFEQRLQQSLKSKWEEKFGSPIKPEALADQRTINRLAPQAQLISFILLIALGPCFVAFGQTPATSEPANGKLASVIQLGEAIVKGTASHSLSKSYVGNALNCTSCHLDNGRHPLAGTFLGTATAYPAWSPREERVITLEDRVLNCFMRSCNGTRPPLGSEVSVAVTAYITSLSQGMPLKMNPERPIGPGAIKQLPIKSDQANVQRGASLYASRCTECHQADGQGDKENPPVWGERSYNDGAGLSSVVSLAAWLKVAMPLDEADLSDEQAIDIAAYVNSQKRPHFDLSQHLPVKERLGEYNASTAK